MSRVAKNNPSFDYEGFEKDVRTLSLGLQGVTGDGSRLQHGVYVAQKQVLKAIARQRKPESTLDKLREIEEKREEYRRQASARYYKGGDPHGQAEAHRTHLVQSEAIITVRLAVGRVKRD